MKLFVAERLDNAIVPMAGVPVCFYRGESVKVVLERIFRHETAGEMNVISLMLYGFVFIDGALPRSLSGKQFTQFDD